MPFIETRDGARLFYRDWGAGRPVLFLSAWAMDSSEARAPMLHLAEHGLRAISLDRRGHGRSDDPGRGYDYLIDHLDLRELTLVGHSMGGGEIVRYLTRHGDDRVAGIALLAAVVPLIRATPDNPDGIPVEAAEQLRASWKWDLGAWLTANTGPYVGDGLPGCEVSPLMRAKVFDTMMRASLQAIIECNRAVVETDFRAELPLIAVPTLIVHGDHDASISLELGGLRQAEMIPGAELRVYENAPHGLYLTHPERLSADLLAFAGAPVTV